MLVKFTIFVLLLIIIIRKTFIVVHEREGAVKEAFGKFVKVLTPGFHFMVPFVDRVAYRHEIREQVVDVAPQPCITRDNIQVEVDGVVYIKVMDPKLASYGISDYKESAVVLAQTTMRSEIGKLSLNESFSKREGLNQKVVEEVDKAAALWGVKVLRYEIMNIIPSKGVINTLEKAMEAERARRAEVTLATAEKEAVSKVSEGKRQEAINISEGEKQKRINEAEGRAQEIAILADATAYGIKRVAEAIRKPKGRDAVNMKICESYIKEFGSILATSNVTVVPKELANIKGLFEGFAKVSTGIPGVANASRANNKKA